MNTSTILKSDEELKKLSYKHYQEWIDFENEKDSPRRWLFGSFATVRGLLRIPFQNGDKQLGEELLKILHEDLAEFERSLCQQTPS